MFIFIKINRNINIAITILLFDVGTQSLSIYRIKFIKFNSIRIFYYLKFTCFICSLAGWVRDPRSKYNLLTMLSIVLFLRSYLFYDYIGIVFITHVHTHLYYSPSRSDTHHFTITLLNIYHHTIKYKSFLNHTIT